MRKQFKDASVEELKEIFKANDKLQEKVEDDYIESQMFNVDEIINCIKGGLNSWSIGAYNRNYIEVSDSEKIEFLHGCIQAINYYGMLEVENKKLVQQTIEKIQELENYAWDFENDDENLDMWVEDDEKYQRLDDEINENIETIVGEIIEYFDSILEATYEYLEYYFMEFYSEERMDAEDFTFDGETYELFEHVEYTKSYA